MDFNIPIQDNNNSQNVLQQISSIQKEPEKTINEPQQQNNNNNEPITITNFIQNSSNPKVCFFTVLFKIIAILSFILLDLFTENESIAIIIVILSGSFDFWFTKNISGRILVGLRWWNHIKKETGQEVWLFESKNEQNKAKADQRTFWTSLYLNTGFWLLLFIWEFIRFKFVWCTVCLIVLIFSLTNLYGFFKCSKIQQNNAKNLTFDIAKNIGKKTIGVNS